jgi:hypothetical protein
MYRTRSTRYRETWQLIRTRSQNREGPPFVEGIVAESSTPIIGRTEIRTPRLIAAGRAGGDAVLAAFGRSDAHMTRELLPVNGDGRSISVRLNVVTDSGGTASDAP